MHRMALGLLELARLHASASVAVRAEQQGSGIPVSVSDTGKGIPQVALPHVFLTVSTGPTAPFRVATPGAGLGLAVAQEVVAAHGGTISVRSAEGRGTGFVVHLPLAKSD